MTYFRHQENKTRLEPMPASIVQAVCQVMGNLEAVKKSAENSHENYRYASADDIYAALVIRMAEAGLMIITLEDEPPQLSEQTARNGQVSKWAKIVFRFVLATSEGTWTDATCRRTIMVPVRGPQAFMAAQSYAEKAFLRSLFKLPTGEMELDEIYQMQEPEDDGPRMNSSAAKRHGIWERAKDAIEAAESVSDLAVIDGKYRAKIPKQWSDPYNDLIMRRQEALGSQML